MIDISEILNSAAHDAPSVARRAMAIIRCLEADVDEARTAARRLLRDGILFAAEQEAFVAEYPWLAETKEAP